MKNRPSKQPRGAELELKNLRFARKFIARQLQPKLVAQLGELSRSFFLSLEAGDLLILNGSWYVTHTGLLNLAARRRCLGIEVHSVPELSDVANSKYAFRAVV